MSKQLRVFVTGFMLLVGLSSAWAEGQSQDKKSENPILAVPAGTARALYSGFQGFGSAFDGILTGDKAPQGSLKGSQDPMPVTEHERKF